MAFQTHPLKRCWHSLDSSDESIIAEKASAVEECCIDCNVQGTEITGDSNLKAEETSKLLTCSNSLEASADSGSNENDSRFCKQNNEADEENAKDTISIVEVTKHPCASNFTNERASASKTERLDVASKKRQVVLTSLWRKEPKNEAPIIVAAKSAEAGGTLPDQDVSEAEPSFDCLLGISDLSNTSSEDSSDDDGCELGIPSSDLPTLWKTPASLKCLQNSSNHAVLFHTNSQFKNLETPPQPFPDTLNIKDIRWDDDHVRLPYAPQNKFLDAGKHVAERWSIITQCLKDRDWFNSLDIEHAIMHYNKYKWDFSGLHKYCDLMTEEEREHFFRQLLPKIANLVLSSPSLCTQPLPLLKTQHESSITMSQEQAACLLANAFFCTFPSRNTSSNHSSSVQLPTINFNSLFRKTSPRYQSSQHAKLNCLLNYFRRVTAKMPAGAISYRRQVLSTKPDWAISNHKLTDLCVTSNGTIEDCANGMLHVDFANKVIGGGVLSEGCVQEEIRFMICPEMIISRLFTEPLADNECLVITGAERFSNYTGYGCTFRWQSNHNDMAPRDSWGRLVNEIVAIDALVFNSLSPQLSEANLCRELNKAFCGFSVSDETAAIACPVATGNWGCGAFGGDHRIKALIQLMAAAIAGRAVYYFTFGDKTLCRDIYQVYSAARSGDLTVGQLWDCIRAGGQSSAAIYDRINSICRAGAVSTVSN